LVHEVNSKSENISFLKASVILSRRRVLLLASINQAINSTLFSGLKFNTVKIYFHKLATKVLTIVRGRI